MKQRFLNRIEKCTLQFRNVNESSNLQFLQKINKQAQKKLSGIPDESYKTAKKD